MEQQIMEFAQRLLSKDPQAMQQYQQIIQAAQSGNEEAAQTASMIEQALQSLQASARNGAKLRQKIDYIKFLKGQCPEGYEMQKFAAGGTVCHKCIKKQEKGNTMEIDDPVKSFKCGRKMKKKACGGNLTKKKK